MSTDYGFACVTCGKNGNGYPAECKIVDNHRKPEQLHKIVEDPNVVLRAVDLLTDLDIDVSDGSYYGLREAIKFASDHIARGHAVRVVDEYGHFYGDCLKRVACPCCGCMRPCSLAIDHEGECSLEAVKK